MSAPATAPATQPARGTPPVDLKTKFQQIAAQNQAVPANATPAPATTKTSAFFDQMKQNNKNMWGATPTDALKNDVDVGKGFVKGALNTTIGTASTIQSAGKKFLTATTGVDASKAGIQSLDSSTPSGAGVRATITPNNPAQKAGSYLETAAELFVGGGEAKKATAVSDVGKVVAEKGKLFAQKSGELGKVLALGKEGVATLDRLSNEEAQKFINGKTFGETVDHVEGAVKKFAENSKSALQAVKDKLPNNNSIDSEMVKDKVESAVTNFFNKSAEYKGIAQRNFSSIDDLISKNLLKPDEARTVNGMRDTISQWKDFSSRGVLNLKEALEAFRGSTVDDMKTNSILNKIGGTLKDVVSDSVGSDEIKTALKTASTNIEKGSDFIRTLVGKSEQQGESKVLTLARNLKDPARNAETLKLVQDLEKATGEKIIPELKGIYDYLKLTKNGAEEAATKSGTIAKNIAKRTGILGGITAAGAGTKDLLFGGK